MERLRGLLARKRRRRPVGLALGGGAVLGAAHLGALRALEEEGVSIDMVAGTSIGAFVASLFAFGKTWSDIQQVVTDLNWLHISKVSLSQYGMLSNHRMSDTLQRIIGKVAFEDAHISLAVVATDISTGQKVILDSGDVATAVMASTCIPGVFIPVNMNERMLVDGGIVENVPISPLKEMGARTVIAVNLSSSPGKPENIVGVLVNAFHYSMEHTTRFQVREADILINLDLTGFNRVDTRQVPQLIEMGYRQTREKLKRERW